MRYVAFVMKRPAVGGGLPLATVSIAIKASFPAGGACSMRRSAEAKYGAVQSAARGVDGEDLCVKICELKQVKRFTYTYR